MKYKILSFIIFILCVLIYFPTKTLRAKEPVTPQRFIILGGIIGGAEIINGIIQLFSKNDETIETNLSPEKKKEIERLLSRSRLLEMLSKTEQPDISAVSNTTSQTSQVIKSTNITIKEEKAKPLSEQVGVIPSEEKEYFVYKITSYTYKTVKKYEKGAVDYYEVGVAYYNIGKKQKAKEYLLHTIAINVRKEEAIEFLIKHYNMTRKEILIEKKKYKKLNTIEKK